MSRGATQVKGLANEQLTPCQFKIYFILILFPLFHLEDGY